MPAADLPLPQLVPLADRSLRARLEAIVRARRLPDVPSEARNQAAVHLWYERRFGTPVAPLESSAAAIATWPETATCVAVGLHRDDSLEVVAPLGLDDLFGLVLRWNPRRVTLEQFRARAAEKRILERWLLVRFVDG